MSEKAAITTVSVTVCESTAFECSEHDKHKHSWQVAETGRVVMVSKWLKW